jgi:outer membrane protein TolC
MNFQHLTPAPSEGRVARQARNGASQLSTFNFQLSTKLALFLLLACSLQALFAHSAVPALLGGIEANNTTLKALREQLDAQKAADRTGSFLPGPEVGVSYLWGTPAAEGNRTDFSIRQTFDFPTVTGMKARAARRQNTLRDLQYRDGRLAILAEAAQYCMEVIYCNALAKELETRLQHALAIAGSYRERLDRGDAGILEYNKALLNLATVQGEIARTEVERAAWLAELQRMNGGLPVVLDDDRYGDRQLPPDFEAWFARVAPQHPALAVAGRQTVLARQHVSLQKALMLPALSAGYMSETTAAQQYRGISLGVSVPLWENRNRIRQAKTAVRAAEAQQADAYQQLHAQLLTACRRAEGLKAVADSYRKALATLGNATLLKKALDAGEISLLDYMLELGLYYDTVNNALEAERDFQKAAAVLSNYEL